MAAPQQDPMTSVMQAALEHPEATQRVANAGAAGLQAARQADPSGQGSVTSGAKVIAGAAAAGGLVVGAAAGSLGLGIIGAAGAAYAATRGDKVGDAARSTGKAAVALGGKAQAINREHKLTDRAAAAAKGAIATARKIDAKHGISDKTATVITAAANKVTKLVAPPPPPPDGFEGVCPPTQPPLPDVSAGASAAPPPPPPPEGFEGVFSAGVTTGVTTGDDALVMGQPVEALNLVTVTATVPGGQQMTVVDEAGNAYAIVVPPGVQVGEAFQFQLP